MWVGEPDKLPPETLNTKPKKRKHSFIYNAGSFFILLCAHTCYVGPQQGNSWQAKMSKIQDKFFFAHLLSHLMESGQAEIVDDSSASYEQGAGLG